MQEIMALRFRSVNRQIFTTHKPVFCIWRMNKNYFPLKWISIGKLLVRRLLLTVCLWRSGFFSSWVQRVYRFGPFQNEVRRSVTSLNSVWWLKPQCIYYAAHGAPSRACPRWSDRNLHTHRLKKNDNIQSGFTKLTFTRYNSRDGSNFLETQVVQVQY